MKMITMNTFAATMPNERHERGDDAGERAIVVLVPDRHAEAGESAEAPGDKAEFDS